MRGTLLAVAPQAREEGRARSGLRRYAANVRRRDPRTLKISGLVLALALSLASFVHVTEDFLTGDPIVRWDVRFARWLHEHGRHPLVRFFDVVTLGGNAAVLIVVVAILGVVLLRRKRPNDAAVLVVALGGAGVLNALLKLVFHRHRPELAFVHLDTYSFPSGHAAASSATFTTLAYLLARRRQSGAARLAIATAAVCGILLVGFSRLYLGAHYFSDVLAGISFGLAWASLCLLGYTLLGERNVLDALPRRLRRQSSR